MKENNLEDFLRENKPQVKDDPTFMLETRQKMDALEGIKDEVDRGRKASLLAIIVALIAGLAIGAAASAFVLLAPKQPTHAQSAIYICTLDLLETWKYLVYALTVGCAIVLGIVLQRNGRESTF